MNLFDPTNYPTSEPAQLVAGDRWVWKRADLGADYPPAAYSLKYSARLEGSVGGEIEITATASGADYVVEVAATTTSVKTPGRYRWQAYVVRTVDAERITVASGIFEVIANRDASWTDPRSHARKVLDAIEAVLEKRATVDQMNYTITTGSGSRSLARMPIADLLVLRDRYRAEVVDEEARLAGANSLGINPRLIGTRFNRV